MGLGAVNSPTPYNMVGLFSRAAVNQGRGIAVQSYGPKTEHVCNGICTAALLIGKSYLLDGPCDAFCE